MILFSPRTGFRQDEPVQKVGKVVTAPRDVIHRILHLVADTDGGKGPTSFREGQYRPIQPIRDHGKVRLRHPLHRFPSSVAQAADLGKSEVPKTDDPVYAAAVSEAEPLRRTLLILEQRPVERSDLCL